MTLKLSRTPLHTLALVFTGILCPVQMAKADLVVGAIHMIMEHRKEAKAMNLEPSLMGQARCLEPVGTLRIHEPEQGGWNSYGLPAPTRVLQAIVNDSNCFRVVDRSAGFDAAQQERALAMTGQLANAQSLVNSQMLSADYVLVPGIIGENAKAGGSSLSASSLLGGIGLSSRKKTAEVVLTLMDVRTSEQIISVTGSAKVSDLNIAANSQDTSGNTASASSWSNTEIGKVIRKAYEDSYKNMIREVGKKNLLARYQTQDLTGTVQAAANQLIEQGVVQAQNIAAQAVQTTAAVQAAATVLTQPELAQAVQAASVPTNPLTSTASAIISQAAPPAAASATDTLVTADSLEVRRRARLFSQASLQAKVLADMREGMLVYPQGQAENGMLKVEDELGNVGWLPVANLKQTDE